MCKDLMEGCQIGCTKQVLNPLIFRVKFHQFEASIAKESRQQYKPLEEDPLSPSFKSALLVESNYVAFFLWC